MRHLFLACGFALAATPLAAFTAINGERVVPGTPESIFEVVSRPGAGPRQIWCAAAQYADQVLGARGGTRVYLAAATERAPRHGNRRTTGFTITPDASLAGGPRPGDGGNYSVSLDRLGYNLSVSHAGMFCENILEELLDRPRWRP